MAKSNFQIGLLGYFDLLGYQNYLDNNDPLSGATEVIKTLNSLKVEIPKKLIELVSTKNSLIKTNVDNMTFLVFSDTIVISLETKIGTTLEQNIDCGIELLTFELATIFLVEKLFNYGLPFRGTLNYGNYLIDDYCFAGNSIIDCYRMTNKIDCATIVCTKSFVSFFESLIIKIEEDVSSISDKKIREDSEINTKIVERAYIQYFKDYLIPYNDGSEEKLKTLNMYKALKMTKKNSNDISQFVFEKFWKHNMDISQNVQSKVSNTIQLLRYLKGLD